MNAPCKPEPGNSDACAELNNACFCISLDRDVLERAIALKADDPQFCAAHLKSRPTLFSNVPVFIPAHDMAAMMKMVRAIEAVVRLPAYRKTVLARAPDIAAHDFGPHGAFMGYDFHLGPGNKEFGGPKLIEINTNAGGAFLNALLADAFRGCCPEIEATLMRTEKRDFEHDVVSMFEQEFKSQNPSGTLRRIAIVDDAPREQYLYPEFVLAQRLFLRHGIDCVIADPHELMSENGKVTIDGKTIDLIYNRLVDFSLDLPAHALLNRAYRDGSVVMTPNPHVHALFADKRNMALFSDPAALRTLGVPEALLGDLSIVPRTLLVTQDNAQILWERRKSLFFKPATGYGSKAVYRGDKLTRAVWDEIRQGQYVAQDLALPSARTVMIDGVPHARKLDVRLYVHDGEMLLAASRLYQGQATNFRTAGGGFAPVFVI